MKRRVIRTLEELLELEASVATAAGATLMKLFQYGSGALDLATFARLKFDTCGCDPVDQSRPLNFVEQLNQSFTYLATIEGVRWLINRHPKHAPYALNLGTSSGSDIVSADGHVVAETFAATHPGSNDKLRKDIAKVRGVAAEYRYVFYLSSARRQAAAVNEDGVTVIHLSHSSLERRWADI
jgi:hypothetical protein